MSAEGVEDIHVLAVDDNADLVDVVAEFLEREHDAISVTTATGAETALDRLATEDVDCVVSDYDMPGQNGLDLLRHVRETHPDLPFILFTGKGSEEIASEAISAGVTEYLQKGTATEQYAVLANRIERAVSETRARRQQAETQRQFTTLVENIPGMVYRCRNERGWPMESISEDCAELTGYPATDLESGDVEWGEDVLHPDDRETAWETVQSAIDAGEAYELTYRIRHRDGDLRWCWERGKPVEEDGDTVALEGLVTDITARKEREQELEAEKEFTENALNALEDVFFVVDPETERLLRWNGRLADTTGYTDAELEQREVSELVADSHVQRVRRAMDEALTAGTVSVEAALVTSDGDAVNFEFRGTVLDSDDGRTPAIAGVGRDISGRRERERDLERYETVVQAVGDPVYALDENGVLTFVNDAIETMTGYTADSLIGSHIGQILPEEDVERGRKHISGLLDDADRRATKVEVEVETADGEGVPSELHIALLPTDDGVFRGTAGTIRDITDRKEREERLEEFAGVVSHDLRNPLNVIEARTTVLRESDDPTADIEAIESATEQMEGLIDDLLTLARQGKTVGEQETVPLNSVAGDAWSSIDAPAATLDRWTTINVHADRDRLRELLGNLFRNSVEHGPADVSITVDRLSDGDGFFVEDDGPGIPEIERDDVFDHGYTTTEDGTGFGLSIVERIAEAHDWRVAVTAGSEGGARFEFRTA